MNDVENKGHSTKELSTVEKISLEIKNELSNEAVSRALLATTFKGLKIESMKQALMEGMIRGFTFQDFLKKDVYAIPFGGGYSLVTSIDNSRKLAMRTGQYVGKSKPEFETETMPDGTERIVSCTVTVKKITAGIVGDYTATVYFDEYTKGRDLWLTKPRTMIAKVAEMHALRMAFPEQLEKAYIEEEITPARMSEAGEKVGDNDLQMGKFLKNGKKTSKQAEGEEGQEDDDLFGAGGDEEGTVR